MFEDFTFDKKVNSSTETDDDPQLSPKCLPYQCSLRKTTPITPTSPSFNPNVDRIDTLVDRMSKQTLIPISRRGLQLDAEHSEVESRASIQQTQVPFQIRASTQMTEHSTEVGSSQQGSGPLIDNKTIDLYAQYKQDYGQERVGETSGPMTEDTGNFRHRLLDNKRSRQQTEARLHSNSSSNLRALDRMTNMIENGVQCNVQISTPGTPILASRRPSSSFAPFIEPDDNVDQPLLVADNMDFEADSGCGELDDETLFRERQAAMLAATPTGVRKSGVLRYRSSTDVALQCRNMKRSVPRMRRRPKIKPPS
ncbi:hypothetical protein F4779DRAFT_18961 [Xylariaceae sp. FL0662B]|nr:hypothetical protein F4779DRAFT_18961 [Xylariaceae sp. FL0662B]